MLTLRRVKEKDITELKAIKERAFKTEFERLGFVSEEMISIDWHLSMMKDSIYYSIINDEALIGGVNVFKFDEGYYLCSLFIDLTLQNKGLGTKIMGQLEKIHDDRNKWQLETPAASTQNHHFYEKVGYTHVNDMVPDGAPEGFSLRVYEKVI